MSIFMDRARALRECTTTHYNCAQAVLLTFAEAAGLEESKAMAVSANFGSGMKMAATCGAITGGLMVLGLFGVEDGKTIGAYFRALREQHNGLLNCADLLRVNKEQGREKKPHCDDMVYECVALVETILRDQGKI